MSWKLRSGVLRRDDQICSPIPERPAQSPYTGIPMTNRTTAPVANREEAGKYAATKTLTKKAVAIEIPPAIKPTDNPRENALAFPAEGSFTSRLPNSAPITIAAKIGTNISKKKRRAISTFKETLLILQNCKNVKGTAKKAAETPNHIPAFRRCAVKFFYLV